MEDKLTGTLAVDLGNTNSVIAFQAEKEIKPVLIEIPDITSSPGILPTIVWFDPESNVTKIGIDALRMKNNANSDMFFHFNFKRLIGNPFEKFGKKFLSPNECGEIFFKSLWKNIPKKFIVKRLVLTAPIDTYKGYRQWLIGLSKSLKVDEVALVDEPTAAGLGIRVPFGSQIMTIDIGGSTVDLTIIKVQGGEGKAAPIAELLKFKGTDISEISQQKIKYADILSKAGSKIGGKDIDQWIVNYFFPSNKDERNLLRAEEIKCKLSSSDIKYEQRLLIYLFNEANEEKEFSISKEIFEKILVKNNFLNHLNYLLKDLLNEARGNFFNIENLDFAILVGGGTQIPLIKKWFQNIIPEKKIRTPAPLEAVALGALSMTPGVKIKDILNKEILIRLFNKREQKHFWHPIFCRGQSWPTEKPFELIVQASKDEQNIFEIVVGETKKKRDFDIIFENGLPKLSKIQSAEEIIMWDIKPLKITLRNKAMIGKDCLKLFFKITEKGDFCVNCIEINGELLGEFNLGNIF